jgi:hypothetical protein
VIDETTLGEAAFELLASSTSRRYMREAQRHAVSSGLVDALRKEPEIRAAARARMAELLRRLEGEKERTPTEFETALLLCALARVDGCSGAVHQATGAASTWIRGLALRLVALGPASSEEIGVLGPQLAWALSGHVVVGEPLDASDRQDPTAFPRAA